MEMFDLEVDVAWEEVCFKIDGIVWKFPTGNPRPGKPQCFKIDGIVWK